MRPLLIAEACNPQWVSIPLEGWSHARAIQRLTGGHIVTQVRNRQALLQAGLVEGTDFTSIDSEALAARVYKLTSLLRSPGKGWTTQTAFSSLVYPYFEHLVWRAFGARLVAGEFDVVHRITPTSPTAPSLLAGRCRRAGVPMVIGPLNGGLPWPPGFEAQRRQEGEWLSYVRGIYKLLPGHAATRRHAAALIMGSRETWAQESPRFHDKCFYIPENGIDPARFAVRRTRTAQRPIRAVFVGRLVPYKGPDMLIEAAAPLIRSGDLTLELIGDGPMRAALQETIDREGIAAGVRLTGWINQDELPRRLAEADILTFPSIREFGGAVVLEAMAVGVVPVVVDYGGPGELVTPETGFAIPLGDRSAIVAALGALLADLGAYPEKIEVKSLPAYRRAHEQFTWDVKARQVLKVYEWVCVRRTKQRRFG